MVYCLHPTCTNELEPVCQAGRPRRFCSNACKQAFHRWSKNGYEHIRLSHRYHSASPVPTSPIKNSG